jgi:hypothetical protein
MEMQEGQERAAASATSEHTISELATLLFDDIEGQISRADTKAELTITADGILAAAVTSLSPVSPTALVATLTNGAAPLTSRVAAGGTILLFIALLVSILCALLVVRPRLRHPGRPSLVYFGQIARLSEAVFIARFLKQSDTEAMVALLADIHTKARIARRKYAGVGLSVILLIVALALWVGAILVQVL